ncbi:hypothetical protein PTI98_007538 [Pleurotus ostreatus]|nr:hypothetical protein PTI98_007538 [Pleurotus ostreatus]
MRHVTVFRLPFAVYVLETAGFGSGPPPPSSFSRTSFSLIPMSFPVYRANHLVFARQIQQGLTHTGRHWVGLPASVAHFSFHGLDSSRSASPPPPPSRSMFSVLCVLQCLSAACGVASRRPRVA